MATVMVLGEKQLTSTTWNLLHAMRWQHILSMQSTLMTLWVYKKKNMTMILLLPIIWWDIHCIDNLLSSSFNCSDVTTDCCDVFCWQKNLCNNRQTNFTFAPLRIWSIKLKIKNNSRGAKTKKYFSSNLIGCFVWNLSFSFILKKLQWDPFEFLFGHRDADGMQGNTLKSS